MPLQGFVSTTVHLDLEIAEALATYINVLNGSKRRVSRRKVIETALTLLLDKEMPEWRDLPTMTDGQQAQVFAKLRQKLQSDGQSLRFTLPG